MSTVLASCLDLRTVCGVINPLAVLVFSVVQLNASERRADKTRGPASTEHLTTVNTRVMHVLVEGHGSRGVRVPGDHSLGRRPDLHRISDLIQYALDVQDKQILDALAWLYQGCGDGRSQPPAHCPGEERLSANVPSPPRVGPY